MKTTKAREGFLLQTDPRSSREGGWTDGTRVEGVTRCDREAGKESRNEM